MSAASQVLVVEDNKVISDLIKSILEAGGYEVVSARNGLEAMTLLRSESLPCLILMDIEMPVMNGWELKAKLSADSRLKEVPIAVMSASRANLDSFHGSLLKLEKPFTIKDLMGVIERHCSPAEAASGGCDKT
jgi:CheY-like chemotaxis protein